MEELKGINVPVKIWAPIAEVESDALTQLRKVSALPWVYHHVAVMADVHVGKGATIGSVIAMRDAVSPAAVGVDIGCGMAAIPTNLFAKDLPDNLEAILSALEEAIPQSFNGHSEVSGLAKDWDGWTRFNTLTPKVQDLWSKARVQMGTLGAGNHFWEICLDTDQKVWLMLHSGSRNIGKTLAEIHIEKAKKLTHNERIIDRDLAVFLAGTKEMDQYRNDLFWAQDYALKSREVMLHLGIKVLQKYLPTLTVSLKEMIACHHNYVAEEVHFGERVFITRKGAIYAGEGAMGIIPGAMGGKSYIVRGKGNPESFNSASHGAGRKMSRSQAKKNFTVADLIKSTEGVCCRKDAGVLDEIKDSYKDLDSVMANQTDLVNIVTELRGILCMKG